MSDELNRPKATDEAGDEVEAHRGGHPKFDASSEAGDEADGGDEVVAHRGGHPKFDASSEAGDEADGGDEVEAHRFSHKMN